MKAVIWDDEALGASFHDEEIPADLIDQAKQYHEQLVELAVRGRRGRDRGLSRRQDADRGRAQGADPQGHHQQPVRADPVRLGLQEQGRAADAGRGGGLSAVAARRAPGQGHRRQDRRGGDARSQGRSAALDARLQDHERPVRRLAHLLPHLFGQGRVRHHAGQHGERQEGAHRPHAADARQSPRGHQGGLYRRHRRAGRPQGRDHRRYAVRSDQARDPRAHGVPRSGHRGRGRAQDQGRPGEARRGAASPGAGGSLLPRLGRSRVGPDHHQGHGRAASRHHRRPHAPRVQGRGQCRRAAGGVPRDGLQARRCRLHAQEADRRLGPVRPRQDDDRAERGRQGLRVREQGGRWQRAEGICPGRRQGRAERGRVRRARGLPDARRQGDAHRRRLSRRRIRR